MAMITEYEVAVAAYQNALQDIMYDEQYKDMSEWEFCKQWCAERGYDEEIAGKIYEMAE